jgi:hypothetical protein
VSAAHTAVNGEGDIIELAPSVETFFLQQIESPAGVEKELQHGQLHHRCRPFDNSLWELIELLICPLGGSPESSRFLFQSKEEKIAVSWQR